MATCYNPTFEMAPTTQGQLWVVSLSPAKPLRSRRRHPSHCRFSVYALIPSSLLSFSAKAKLLTTRASDRQRRPFIPVFRSSTFFFRERFELSVAVELFDRLRLFERFERASLLRYWGTKGLNILNEHQPLIAVERLGLLKPGNLEPTFVLRLERTPDSIRGIERLERFELTT